MIDRSELSATVLAIGAAVLAILLAVSLGVAASLIGAGA